MFEHRIELLNARGEATDDVDRAKRARLHSAGYCVPIGGNWRAIHYAVSQFQEANEKEKAQLFLSGVMMGLLSDVRALRRAKAIV